MVLQIGTSRFRMIIREILKNDLKDLAAQEFILQMSHNRIHCTNRQPLMFTNYFPFIHSFS